MPVIAARKEAFGDAENRKTSENGENLDEDLRTNLIRVPCIQYPITFQK